MSGDDASKPPADDGSNGETTAKTGPGASMLGVPGIVTLSCFLVVSTVMLMYVMLLIWPIPTPSRQEPPTTETRTASTPASTEAVSKTSSPVDPPSSGSTRAAERCTEPCNVTIFRWSFQVWNEQRLLLIVLLAGALGSLVHALRSLYWYVGNRNCVRSWLAMYFLLPFSGATLALIFYLVVRGGFFSPQSSFEQTSPFGFAAMSALIGMFSQQAVLKLQSVAETLLTKPEPGKNSTPQEPSKDGAKKPATDDEKKDG